MQVDMGSVAVEDPSSAVGTGGDAAALSVSLHPGVLLSISAHLTKTKVQTGQSQPRILGGFLGKQDGRQVEVFMAYESIFVEVEGNVIVDMEFLKNREAQFKQVAQYKDYDFLGWYTACAAPGPQELAIQRQFIEFNETPLVLIIDAASVEASQKSVKVTRELPIHLFESLVRVVEGEATMQFSRINFTIATQESERVSVDQVARAQSSTGSSQMDAHLGSLSGAIRQLNERLKLLYRYIDAVEKGEVEGDSAILRRIHSLTTQLPAADAPEFRQDISTEYTDALLTTYLAALTKSASTLSDTIDKFNVVNTAQGAGRERRGLRMQ